jgi:hypothetical protein
MTIQSVPGCEGVCFVAKWGAAEQVEKVLSLRLQLGLNFLKSAVFARIHATNTSNNLRKVTNYFTNMCVYECYETSNELFNTAKVCLEIMEF